MISSAKDDKDIKIEDTNFKSLNLREEHIEDVLRKNIEVIFQDETLLVFGSKAQPRVLCERSYGRGSLAIMFENVGKTRKKCLRLHLKHVIIIFVLNR